MTNLETLVNLMEQRAAAELEFAAAKKIADYGTSQELITVEEVIYLGYKNKENDFNCNVLYRINGKLTIARVDLMKWRKEVWLSKNQHGTTHHHHLIAYLKAYFQY